MLSTNMIESLTGVKTRVSKMKAIHISNISHHSHDQKGENIYSNFLIPTASSTGIENDEHIESNNKTCVYVYEDKYTFSRILVSDCIVFDSHFESGNLASAYRINPAEISEYHGKYRDIYELNMSYDIGTNGYTQWFYFSCTNIRVGKVLFIFKNFSKPYSLFSCGMKPLIYSTLKKYWTRCGQDIAYYPDNTNNNAANNNNNSTSYNMSFSHFFEKPNEKVYFAFCHPYTYTDLQLYLLYILRDPLKSKYIRRKLLCKTIAGNQCDLLTIAALSNTPEELSHRNVIIILSRVHPGESNSSWIMQGIIDYLLSDCIQAQQLREMYIFKIIPMLNPDGVINGNNRCDISGLDLNRCWANPNKSLHPTIYYAKELIKEMKRKRVVSLVLDLHGHSNREGIFFYGCAPDKKMMLRATESASSSMSQDAFFWRVKLYSRILQALSPLFSIEHCSYKIHKEKAATLRMVAFLELQIDCVYTVEASLGGKAPNLFTAHDLLHFGGDMCRAMLELHPAVVTRTAPVIDAGDSSSGGVDSSTDEKRGFADEILERRTIYGADYFAGVGAALLSPWALKELTQHPDQCMDDDDSDNPDDDGDSKQIRPPGKQVPRLRAKCVSDKPFSHSRNESSSASSSSAVGTTPRGIACTEMKKTNNVVVPRPLNKPRVLSAPTRLASQILDMSVQDIQLGANNFINDPLSARPLVSSSKSSSAKVIVQKGLSDSEQQRKLSPKLRRAIKSNIQNPFAFEASKKSAPKQGREVPITIATVSRRNENNELIIDASGPKKKASDDDPFPVSVRGLESSLFYDEQPYAHMNITKKT